MTDQPAVRMAPPPPQVLRVVNPVVRRLLLSPLAGRLPPALVVLELTGRRTGRSLAVPVGLHELPEGRVVFSEAPWRLNFAGGRALVVRRGRERRSGRGVLVEDPERVARTLAVAVEQVGARGLAMHVAPGHRLTHDDLVRLGRSMVVVDLDG